MTITTDGRRMMNSNVCVHGSLKRQCQICDQIAEIEELHQQLAEAKKDAGRWKFYAGRVASRIGISLEQFTDDIDQAMKEGE